MDLQKVKADIAKGMMIDRAEWMKVLDYAASLEMVAVDFLHDMDESCDWPIEPEDLIALRTIKDRFEKVIAL